MLDMQDVQCPYCGEWNSVTLDASAGAQSYIEDCYVCCRPITVQLALDADDVVQVQVRTQDDA